MKASDSVISFREREFKGSRLRCLMMTSQTRNRVAEFLTSLVDPFASVAPEALVAPRGFLKPGEGKLGKTPGFLSERDMVSLTKWWLDQPQHANTPNWDLISQCRIGDRRGLVLVEAKAHKSEFADDRCEATSQENIASIDRALAQASGALSGIMPGFSLSSATRYQLSNRFAFAWKLASMGIPVVLVYLGFLHAEELSEDKNELFLSHEDWRSCVLKGSEGIVPTEAWNKSFDIDGTPLTVLLRSAQVRVEAVAEGR